MRIFLWVALAWLFSAPAFAGNGTITTKDASGVTQTFDVVTDGSGNFNAKSVTCDGTAAANCAAVKAASTAAGATDPALVVAISPNNSVAVTGTFFQATQPVSAAALPLPTGAATQTTLASVLTALGSPFQAGGSIGNTAFTANAGTNLNTSLLALESGGNLAQVVTDFGAPGATACSSDTASCNQNQLMQRLAQRLTTINGTLNSPFQAGGSIGNTAFIANAGTNLNTSALGTSANQTTIIGSLATIATNSGLPVPNGGPLGTPTESPCTLPATGTSCDLIQIDKAIANAVNSPPPLGTANGWTPLKLAALTNTAVAIKASAGQLGKLYCYNPNATVAYIQVYNVASGSVTVGTTAALQSYGIPPTSASGFVSALVGDQYGTAMSVAATTTAGGGTAPSTAIDCDVSYN